MKAESAKLAKIIWDYMLVGHLLKKCDAILILGSRDDRVANYGAQLLLDGYGDILIISGGAAHANDLLATNWAEPTEAEHFATIAKQMGVAKNKILLEKYATNTGENIRFTQKIIEEKNLKIKSLLLVQKPYMERRTFTTFKKQWVGDVEFIVSSPPIKFEDYFNKVQPFDDILNIMVGDLQRIIEYPKLGFQIPQDVPSNVLKAYDKLVELGYTKHLIK